MKTRTALLFTAVAVAGGLIAAVLYQRAPITEEEPEQYVVVRGDTLFEIAQQYSVTVDELRTWNGIQGDLIEVDQVLLIWPGDGAKPEAAPRRTSKKGSARRPRPRVTGSVVASGTAEEQPTLELPEEQPCLQGPNLDALDADEQMIGSSGLSYDQIRTSMGAFVHNTLPCIHSGEAFPIEELELEINVACTGRVDAVRVVNPGDWTDEMAACVSDTLRYAPFPAHDLPNGEVFLYPLRFTPG